MKMIAGSCLRAIANSRRMRAAPSPANISTNEAADWAKNCAPDSCATAFASSVLPVPGGPCRRMPFGTFAPSCSNCLGSRRNSTISCSSALASSTPAMSAHATDWLEAGLICCGLIRGITFSVRHITKRSAAKNTIIRTGSHWSAQFCSSGHPGGVWDERRGGRDSRRRRGRVRIHEQRMCEPGRRRLEHTAHSRHYTSMHPLQYFRHPWHLSSIAVPRANCQEFQKRTRSSRLRHFGGARRANRSHDAQSGVRPDLCDPGSGATRRICGDRGSQPSSRTARSAKNSPQTPGRARRCARRRRGSAAPSRSSDWWRWGKKP